MKYLHAVAHQHLYKQRDSALRRMVCYSIYVVHGHSNVHAVISGGSADIAIQMQSADWALDLPPEAHGSLREAVATAPTPGTPGHHYCMKLLERKGFLVLPKQQIRWECHCEVHFQRTWPDSRLSGHVTISPGLTARIIATSTSHSASRHRREACGWSIWSLTVPS